MEFSEKLMTLRKKAGLSQEQLADRLGVTRQSVSKWESGSAVPELVKLIALSDMFGVSVDYLVKDAMEEPEETEREAGGVSAARAERLERKVDDLADSCRSSWGLIITTPAGPTSSACPWSASASAGIATPPGTPWRWASSPSGTSPWALSA